MELSCPVKVMKLPILCDTIIISTSTTFDVKHFACDRPADIRRILNQYKQKYKIVLVSDTEESGRDLIKKVVSFEPEVPAIG